MPREMLPEAGPEIAMLDGLKDPLSLQSHTLRNRWKHDEHEDDLLYSNDANLESQTT